MYEELEIHLTNQKNGRDWKIKNYRIKLCEMPGRVATLSLCVGEHWTLLRRALLRWSDAGTSLRRSALALDLS